MTELLVSVIEHPDGTRGIVVQNRFGGYSFDLQEAEALASALYDALLFSEHHATLPEALPNLHKFLPRKETNPPSLESLA